MRSCRSSPTRRPLRGRLVVFNRRIDSEPPGETHVHLHAQTRRHREEVDRDRRRGPRRRPPRLVHRHAPARQAQADLHAARRLRRQRHRHQRRQGGVHRPQARPARSTTGTPAIPAASRSAPRKSSSRAASPSASSRRPSSACSRAARSAASRCCNLRVYKGAEHPHEAQQPETLDVAAMNPKNVRA